MDKRPEPNFPVTARDAVEQASWWMRYAVDRAGDDPKVGVAIRSHGQAAITQHDAVRKAIDSGSVHGDE